MPIVSRANNLNLYDSDNIEQRATFYEQLKQREQDWWKTRQHLINLEERQMFWFGENSLMMWLLWQLVSYVVVAIVLMLLSKLLDTSIPVWEYITVFAVQTAIFIIMLFSKGRLANRLQSKIDEGEVTREEMLDEMAILASDSLFLDVHARSPISLQQLYEHYNAELHLSSLHCLLQREVDAGRIIVRQPHPEANGLPLELADHELAIHANEIIYKSVL